MSISSLLFTARDSLLAHQLAIDVTGANIANVSTTGYTRQRAVMESVGNVDVRAGVAQVGVNVDRIERIYERYTESQLIEQQQNSSYSDAMLQGLQSIESILDDTGGNGISDQLNAFWAAWDNLSGNPAGQVERSNLLSSAESLAGTLNTYSRNLDSINTDMNRTISDTVSQINNKVAEISSLNEKILGTPGGDIGNSNDLMDKRSVALQELAKLVNFTHIENADGTINVSLSNGEPLVQGIMSRTLSVKPDTNGCLNVYSSNSSDEPLNDTLTSGKIGAYLELQNTIVPGYRDDINRFATALADRVNDLHASGYDADNNTGIDFFSISDRSNAAESIRVNSVITADINKIACSESVSGDGNIAGRIASIQNELLMNSNTATLNGYLATTVGRIGNQVANAGTNNDRQAVILNHLNNQRESASGVSIDEEMILLIKYQMGYTAAGKLCSTVNEMLDTLMGLVK